MIALLASAVGNCIVKSPDVDVLSAPKSNAQTEGSPEALSLNISAPLAVMLLDEKVKSEKSVKAVVPEVLGSTLVKEAPLAVYPVPDTSLDVVYAEVLASKEAELVYKARLNVLPPEFLKLCTASKISFLKLVHIAVVIDITIS
jgi:hypothetical protein